jgi:hypothetical protein
MVVLNFTCREKKQALLKHECCQTIRTSVKKFYKKQKLLHELKTIKDATQFASNYMSPTCPLHIWWNARNFHVEDICECGKPHNRHACYKDEWLCPNMAMNAPAGTMVSDLTRFKLAKQGLGKSQFLGMGEITSIVKKKVREITEEDAIADGFKEKTLMSEQGNFIGVPARYQLRDWLLSHNKNLTLDSEVFLIQWVWK